MSTSPPRLLAEPFQDPWEHPVTIPLVLARAAVPKAAPRITGQPQPAGVRTGAARRVAGTQWGGLGHHPGGTEAGQGLTGEPSVAPGPSHPQENPFTWSQQDQLLSMVSETPKGWSQPIFPAFPPAPPDPGPHSPPCSAPARTSSWPLPHPCWCSSFTPECPCPSNKLLLILQGPAETSQPLKKSPALPSWMSPRGASVRPWAPLST